MAGKPKIFVAYPYAFPAEDYRRPFVELADSFSVQFVFADAEITSQHILDKIAGMIRESRFALFDITTWNPNVTLELGIAIGYRQPYYLLFDPTKKQGDVLSDLGGIDRIQYTSYGTLSAGLTKLMLQQFGPPQTGQDWDAELESLSAMVLEVLGEDKGLNITEISERLAVPLKMAQVVVRPMVGSQLETTGKRKGVRYYLLGHAPASKAKAETVVEPAQTALEENPFVAQVNAAKAGREDGGA